MYIPMYAVMHVNIESWTRTRATLKHGIQAGRRNRRLRCLAPVERRRRQGSTKEESRERGKIRGVAFNRALAVASTWIHAIDLATKVAFLRIPKYALQVSYVYLASLGLIVSGCNDSIDIITEIRAIMRIRSVFYGRRPL